MSPSWNTIKSRALAFSWEWAEASLEKREAQLLEHRFF